MNEYVCTERERERERERDRQRERERESKTKPTFLRKLGDIRMVMFRYSDNQPAMNYEKRGDPHTTHHPPPTPPPQPLPALTPPNPRNNTALRLFGRGRQLWLRHISRAAQAPSTTRQWPPLTLLITLGELSLAII